MLECHVIECVVEGEGNTHVPMRARLCHSLRRLALRLFLVDVGLELRCQTSGRLPDVGGVGGLGAVHGREVLGATCVIVMCKVAYERPDKPVCRAQPGCTWAEDDLPDYEKVKSIVWHARA